MAAGDDIGGGSGDIADAPADVASVTSTNGDVTVTESSAIAGIASGLADPAVAEGLGPQAGSLGGQADFFNEFYGEEINSGPPIGAGGQGGFDIDANAAAGLAGELAQLDLGDLANLGYGGYGAFTGPVNPEEVVGPAPLAASQLSFSTQINLGLQNFRDDLALFGQNLQTGLPAVLNALNPVNIVSSLLGGNQPAQAPASPTVSQANPISAAINALFGGGQSSAPANPALGTPAQVNAANLGFQVSTPTTPAQNALAQAIIGQIPFGGAVLAAGQAITAAQQAAAINAFGAYGENVPPVESFGVAGFGTYSENVAPTVPSGSFATGNAPPGGDPGNPFDPNAPISQAELERLRILQANAVSAAQDPGGGGGGGGGFFGDLLAGAGLVAAGVAGFNALSSFFGRQTPSPTSYSLEAFGAYSENVPPTGPVSAASSAIPASEAFGSYAENIAPTVSAVGIGRQILSDVTAAANNIRTALPQILPFLNTAQAVAGAAGIQLPGGADVAALLGTTNNVVNAVSGLTGNAARNPFAVAEDPLNAQYSVYNTITGDVIATGLSQQDAARQVAGLGIASNAVSLATSGQTSLESIFTGLRAITGTPQGINAIGAISGVVTKQNDFGVLEDPLNGTWSIYNKVNNTVLEAGLSQQEANQRVQALGIFSSAVSLATSGQTNIGAIIAGLPVGSNAVNAITGLAAQQTQFGIAQDPNTGTYSVYNRNTGATVLTGLSEQAAREQAQGLGIITTAVSLAGQGGTTVNNTILNSLFPPTTAAGGGAAGGTTAINLGTGANAGAVNGQTNVAALVAQARQQQTVRELRQNKAQSGDWRVRLRLAPNSDYLYNDPSNGLLAPLSKRSGTDGVIFPYTPSIDTSYKANYDAYDLTHSNYRGYFYRNSYVDAVNIRAQFTAQDTNEADYLLAVIHFFRSVTKMFYGQDAQRGTPPPLVYLSGLGNLQFAEHPCLISQFNYVLPPDVDYIRANSVLSANTNLLGSRVRSTSASNPLAYSVNRLLNNRLTQGAQDNRPSITTNLGAGNPTYVPTKMEISLTLLPIQTRVQASQQFSVKAFANGNLLSNGFW